MHNAVNPIAREELDRKAHAEAIAAGAPATCGWLIRVPNSNPEPDCEADCYDIVECGVAVTYDIGGFSCLAGHDHRTYGGPDHTEYFDADLIDRRLGDRFFREVAQHQQRQPLTATGGPGVPVRPF